MTRYIKCDSCSFEAELSSKHSIIEGRVAFGNGEELLGDLCPKCRADIREMFPKEEELTVPGFMERVPVDEEWDGVDRAQVPV